METNVNYTIVGAFVISLTAAIILAIIWLSSGLSTYDYTTYKVYMKESVSGLSIDSPVEFNGVNVGNVTSIEINHRNPQLVKVLIKVKNDTPITMGTRAKLDVRSLSGLAYIQLQDKGLDMRPLVKEKDQDYPIISTIPSILVRLDTALTQLNDSFHQLSYSIRSLLDKQNLQSIKEILINLNEASKQFSPLLISGQKTFHVLQTQTLPGANESLMRIDQMSQDLNDLSLQLKQNPSILIRGRAQRPPGPGE